MDGRKFISLGMIGCLLAASLGCNRNTQPHSQYGQMPQTEGAKLVNMPLDGTSKSLWGKSNGPSVPVELLPPKNNQPASAESIAAMADVQLEAAFDPLTTPGSKEELLDRARKGYQKALKQDPKCKAAMLGLARFYARLGEREKALQHYKECLRQHSTDSAVAHEIAMVHARWKDFPGAVAWCEYTLTNIDPEHRGVKKSMGFCLALAGRWDEALEVLCQIMPEAQARHNLAGLMDQMGQADACKMQLQKALQADPNYVRSAEFLAELEQLREQNAILPAGGIRE